MIRKVSRVELIIAKCFAYLPLHYWSKWKVYGAENVPHEGGLLILSNHISDLDPVAIQYFCKRPIHFMAKSELFEMKILKNIMHFWGCFPVTRNSADRTSLKTAIELIKSGRAVCIFPEGEISESGTLLPLKGGIALIAKSAGCPVICIGLSGAEKVMPYGKTKPKRAPGVTIEGVWGNPKDFGGKVEVSSFVDWTTKELGDLIRRCVPHPAEEHS